MVIFFWVCESAPLVSNSKDIIKKKLMGIKHELQANHYKGVKDRCTPAKKLDAVLSSPWRTKLCESLSRLLPGASGSPRPAHEGPGLGGGVAGCPSC